MAAQNNARRFGVISMNSRYAAVEAGHTPTAMTSNREGQG
jgi:hypothetical protein